MAEVNPQQLRDLGAGNPDLYRYDDDPAVQARQLQDLWMQFRGPQGYQMRPATPDNFPAPLDYSSLMRQLVQMASDPQHPDQAQALRHLQTVAFGVPAGGFKENTAGARPVESYPSTLPPAEHPMRSVIANVMNYLQARQQGIPELLSGIHLSPMRYGPSSLVAPQEASINEMDRQIADQQQRTQEVDRPWIDKLLHRDFETQPRMIPGMLHLRRDY